MADLGIQPATIRTITPSASWASDELLTALIGAAQRRLARQLRLRGCDLSHLTDDADTADLVKDTIIAAVSRVVRNPAAAEGLSSESEGGYSYSTSGPLDTSSNVWFPDSELDLLCPARPLRAIRQTVPRRRHLYRRRGPHREFW